MSTLSSTVTKIDSQPAGFSASVQVEIPPNTKHYELDTEQFGYAADAMLLTNPPPGPTVILVTGPNHPVIKVGAIVKGNRT